MMEELPNEHVRTHSRAMQNGHLCLVLLLLSRSRGDWPCSQGAHKQACGPVSSLSAASAVKGWPWPGGISQQRLWLNSICSIWLQVLWRDDRPQSGSTLAYLAGLAGLRTVPIELGRHYLADGWGQRLVRFSGFRGSACSMSPLVHTHRSACWQHHGLPSNVWFIAGVLIYLKFMPAGLTIDVSGPDATDTGSKVTVSHLTCHQGEVFAEAKLPQAPIGLGNVS